MMECPNCKMSIKGGSTFCIHCGAQLGAIGNNQPMSNTSPMSNTPTANQPMNMPPIGNQTPNGVAPTQSTATNQTQVIQQPVQNTPVTYESGGGKTLVTLPALGILIIYSYAIITLSVLIYSYIKLGTNSVYTTYVKTSIFASKIFWEIVGVDLLLIVSSIFTVLHKKIMGFAAILYSIAFIIYDLVKLDKAIMPIVACVFVILCAICYISEEAP